MRHQRFFQMGLLGGAILLFSQFTYVHAESNLDAPVLAAHAKAAILMDAGTGTVIFAKNELAHLPIASVTKVMTMLLVFDALEKGQIHLQDQVRVSEHAASMGGSQIFLEPHETMTMRDLIKGIAMASANDATVAVAEHISGSEGEFVRQMNQKLTTLGLKNSHFKNTNGLPVAGHYSSAYDVAVMSRALLRYDGVTQFTSAYSDYLRKTSKNPFWLVNTNKLVRFYPGMDGVKTGYTSDALFCLSGSAKRGDFRVIAVVLGEPSTKVRNAEVTEMMNYAFTHYSAKAVYKKGQIVTLAPVHKGESEAVAVKATRAATILVKNGDKHPIGQVVTEINPLNAPVKKGQVAGYLTLMSEGQRIDRIPLVTTADIQRVTWLEMLGRSLHKLFVFGVKAQ